MSHFDHLSCLKIRATWFAKALSERLKVPVLTGVPRYNLYSQLLGFKNHTWVVKEYKKDPDRIGRVIFSDRYINAYQVLANYFPAIGSEDLFDINDMSLPYLGERHSLEWRNVTLDLLSKKNLELRYLRGYKDDIVHYLTETLIELAGAVHTRAIKYQLRIVIILLVAMEKEKFIPPVRISHIADILRPECFLLLQTEFYTGRLQVENDSFVMTTVPRYFDLMSRVGGGVEDTWKSLEPIFTRITGIKYDNEGFPKMEPYGHLEFNDFRVEIR